MHVQLNIYFVHITKSTESVVLIALEFLEEMSREFNNKLYPFS